MTARAEDQHMSRKNENYDLDVKKSHNITLRPTPPLIHATMELYFVTGYDIKHNSDDVYGRGTLVFPGHRRKQPFAITAQEPDIDRAEKSESAEICFIHMFESSELISEDTKSFCDCFYIVESRRSMELVITERIDHKIATKVVDIRYTPKRLEDEDGRGFEHMPPGAAVMDDAMEEKVILAFGVLRSDFSYHLDEEAEKLNEHLLKGLTRDKIMDFVVEMTAAQILVDEMNPFEKYHSLKSHITETVNAACDTHEFIEKHLGTSFTKQELLAMRPQIEYALFKRFYFDETPYSRNNVQVVVSDKIKYPNKRYLPHGKFGNKKFVVSSFTDDNDIDDEDNRSYMIPFSYGLFTPSTPTSMVLLVDNDNNKVVLAREKTNLMGKRVMQALFDGNFDGEVYKIDDEFEFENDHFDTRSVEKSIAKYGESEEREEIGQVLKKIAFASKYMPTVQMDILATVIKRAGKKFLKMWRNSYNPLGVQSVMESQMVQYYGLVVEKDKKKIINQLASGLAKFARAQEVDFKNKKEAAHQLEEELLRWIDADTCVKNKFAYLFAEDGDTMVKKMAKQVVEVLSGGAKKSDEAKEKPKDEEKKPKSDKEKPKKKAKKDESDDEEEPPKKKAKSAKVVNLKVKYLRPKYENVKEWMKDKNHVYIGRRGVVFIDRERFPKQDSVWANPFKIDEDNTREDVIRKYKKYIKAKIEKGEVNLEDLRGKVLGCWCAPDPCHGDILVSLLNEK